MFLFTVRDTVHTGFPFPLRQGILLEPRVAADIEKAERDGRERVTGIRRASVNITADGIILDRPPVRMSDVRMALVSIETAAGVGGRVHLTANAYDTTMKNGRVAREYRAFPDAGVQALAPDAAVRAANNGVEELDLVVVMYPGSSFRIFRTGQLEGASPQMFVHWNGRNLNLAFPRQFRPETAQEAGFLDVAP